MTIAVNALKGVTPEITTALHAMGITDSDQLLAAAGHPNQ
jgi:hypothetical protein